MVMGQILSNSDMYVAVGSFGNGTSFAFILALN